MLLKTLQKYPITAVTSLRAQLLRVSEYASDGHFRVPPTQFDAIHGAPGAESGQAGVFLRRTAGASCFSSGGSAASSRHWR